MSGRGPGQRVAVAVPRSAEAIVAILAVLKTGAAYVPIDPSVPAARVQFVLGDAAPIAAVTTAEVRRSWVASPGRSSTSTTPPSPASRHGLPVPSADSIAYIIYTSGTTGTPRAWR
ncbi:AMP-binding enzyme family protein [Mycobacterium intracellulare 1956]|uniref:AMP-binding enzyme family protein n=1 Tax=Mycobacterium intracellulare 1956 TaxID=1299331 RepID=X8CG09_MYCIT|nr:AMP-binding enzyme family protein [Mycobacterium intracellulare 1956]